MRHSLWMLGHPSPIALLGLVAVAAGPARIAAQGKTGGDQVVAAPVGAELTDALLAQFMKGLAAKDVARQARDAVEKQIREIYKQASALESKAGAEVSAASKLKSEWDKCASAKRPEISKTLRDSTDAARERRDADRVRYKAYTDASSAISRAEGEARSARNDAAVDSLRIQRDKLVASSLGYDRAVDSARIVEPCGPKPARPAAQVRADSLRASTNILRDSSRKLEERAEKMGAAEAGLDVKAWALVREKVEAFLSKGNGAGVLTADELSRLRAKKLELVKYRRIL